MPPQSSPQGWTDEDLDEALSLEVYDDFAATPAEANAPDVFEAPAPAAASAHQFNVGDMDQPVPRIVIHASCDRSEVARAISAAARDRRLAKATVTVELGGITAAHARLSNQRSPDLLILDCIATPANLLAQLDRLAEHVDEGSKVLVIGAANDITLYRELMARGVSDYLVAPVDALSLARAIGRLYVDPDKPFAGRLVSVIGAKGGSGASTIAHNLAWNIAERCGANATLVDLDVPFGTASLDFNQDPPQTVAEALASPDRVDPVLIDRLLTRQTERLLLFSAPGAVDRDFDFPQEAYDTLIDAVRRTSPFVVLDLPHQWSPWVRDTLVASDNIVIVTTPELAALRNTKNVMERLARGRSNDRPPHVVLNMTGVLKRPEIPTKDFAEALGCELAAVLPFEPSVFGQASNNGQMLGELTASARSTEELEALAMLISGQSIQPRRKSSLLDKLPFLKR
jgi:pilus assembly protein CpaE